MGRDVGSGMAHAGGLDGRVADRDRIERLIAHLAGLLRSYPTGLDEYRLMRRLAAQGDAHFAPARLRSPAGLFEAHFLLFHGLYRLRDRLRAQRCADLRIECLDIRLLPHVPAAPGIPAPADPLRAYYLDLDRLRRTTPEVAAGLLGSGRTRLRCRRGAQDALRVLGLEAGASATEIKRRYRRLAMVHHPDRGGDPRRLREINVAMGVLCRRRGPPGG